MSTLVHIHEMRPLRVGGGYLFIEIVKAHLQPGIDNEEAGIKIDFRMGTKGYWFGRIYQKYSVHLLLQKEGKK